MLASQFSEFDNFPKPIIILVGQMRLLSRSSKYIEKLSKNFRIFAYTDAEGALALAGAEYVERVIDTTSDSRFTDLMGHADSPNCRAKLYQWARLGVALDDLLSMRRSGLISPEMSILKLRSDIRLGSMYLSKVQKLEATSLVCKTDWIYAFKASKLEVMKGIIDAVITWKETRSLTHLPIESLPRTEFGAVRINWMPFSFAPGLLRSSILRGQKLFSVGGRLGEWCHRVLVLSLIALVKKGGSKNTEFARAYSKHRNIREDNCVASEIIFTHYVLQHFKHIQRIFPVGMGSLYSNRKRR